MFIQAFILNFQFLRRLFRHRQRVAGEIEREIEGEGDRECVSKESTTVKL